MLVPGLGRIGAPAPAPAEQRLARISSRRGSVGTVVVYQPLDATLAARLRSAAGVASSDTVAVVVGGRLVASSPALSGSLVLPPASPASRTLDGIGYRAVVSPRLRSSLGEQIAVLSPLSLVSAADATTRSRLLLFLGAMLVLVAGGAYLEGRAVVRTLHGLANAVNGFAAGRLTERAPAGGRDEFAQLARSFNTMAGQLEARLEELRAERSRLAAAVARIGTALSATHDTEQLIGVVLETTLEATGARSAALVLADGSEHRLGEAQGGERIELLLASARSRLGVLTLEGPEFSEEQRQMASSLAAHATVALENADLYAVVERQATVDGLTGLANRRRGEQALAAELARARRTSAPFSLVVCDLDDFKRTNDRYGHAVGDAVLRAFAEEAEATIRESDLACRWGGEEFVLLLPATNREGAARLAERLRSGMAARSLLSEEGEAFSVSASFGVASYPEQTTADALFSAADAALYRAKERGKNRVER